MRFLSKAFGRKSEGLPPWAALDQESLRISAAMEHLEEHGNLDSFPGSQNEKLALIMTAGRQGLVGWNRERERYELTSIGRERLGMRRMLREPGGPIDLPAEAANVPPDAAGASGAAPGTVPPRPANSGNPPRPEQAQAPAQTPAPPQEQASVARNPGIPCLAGKCLETGGTAERSTQPAGKLEQARTVPPPAAAPAA